MLDTKTTSLERKPYTVTRTRDFWWVSNCLICDQSLQSVLQFPRLCLTTHTYWLMLYELSPQTRYSFYRYHSYLTTLNSVCKITVDISGNTFSTPPPGLGCSCRPRPKSTLDRHQDFPGISDLEVTSYFRSYTYIKYIPINFLKTKGYP